MRSTGFFLVVSAALCGCASVSSQTNDAVRGRSAEIAADGLISIRSPHSVPDTIERLQELAGQRDLKVFARVDHAAGAASVGASLRPMQVLIFGNPQGGTPLMQCAQTIGIDLPLKALVWEDEASQVWLGYNDPVHLARRHGVAQCPAAGKIRTALADLAAAAVAP